MSNRRQQQQQNESLEKTLQDLPKLLREREAQLEEREREVKRLKTALEREYPQLLQSSSSPSDVLRLNVGGQRMDVLRRTMTQVDNSLLASKFSGRWSMEKDFDGCIFVDQPAELFVPLINFLRAKQSETPLTKKTAPPRFDTTKAMDDFCRIVEYYGVSLAVYPIGIYRLECQAKWKLVGEGECQLESPTWATYALKPYGDIHARNVESFEITLEEHCSSVQIGWISLFNLHKFSQSENGRGVGYGSTSVALDCVKEGIVEAGNLLALPTKVDLVHRAGTTIRSEKWGSDWYVNGILVASTSEEKSHVLKLGSPYLDTVPCLSIKGTCRISKIELTF